MDVRQYDKLIKTLDVINTIANSVDALTNKVEAIAGILNSVLASNHGSPEADVINVNISSQPIDVHVAP